MILRIKTKRSLATIQAVARKWSVILKDVTIGRAGLDNMVTVDTHEPGNSKSDEVWSTFARELQ